MDSKGHELNGDVGKGTVETTVSASLCNVTRDTVVPETNSDMKGMAVCFQPSSLRQEDDKNRSATHNQTR